MDDYHSEFDFEPTVATKLKSIKKPADKFFIKETIYEMEDVEDMDDDDFSLSDEVETKRYKCSSPRRKHCSVRSPELDFEYDDCGFDEYRSMAVDIPASQRHVRTFSNSSETDE